MNKGVPLTVFICCIWPVLFHLALTYGLKFITRRDWHNFNWSEFLSEINPWSRKQQ